MIFHGAHDFRTMPPYRRGVDDSGDRGDPFETWANPSSRQAALWHPLHPFAIDLTATVPDGSTIDAELAGRTVVPWTNPQSIPSHFVTFAMAKSWEVNVTATSDLGSYEYSGTIERKAKPITAPLAALPEAVETVNDQFLRRSRPEGDDGSERQLYLAAGSPSGTLEDDKRDQGLGIGTFLLQLNLETRAAEWYAFDGFFVCDFIFLTAPGTSTSGNYGGTDEWNYFGDLALRYNSNELQISGEVTPVGALDFTT